MLIKRKSIEKEESSRAARKPAGATSGKIKRKPQYEPVTLSELDGVRYLHFGTEWVQGAMRIKKPDWPELTYAQYMMSPILYIEHPKHMVQLGLGTAALTKFCYRNYPEARVSAVELNPEVIRVCESMFKMPPNDERLTVMAMDAFDFVTDSANHGTVDILQVDLYDATARGPVLDTPEFYNACLACLTDDGIMTVNLFGEHASYRKNLDVMLRVFDSVICLPQVNVGNVIALGFKKRRGFDMATMLERAAAIQASNGLPAKDWVEGIQKWNAIVNA